MPVEKYYLSKNNNFKLLTNVTNNKWFVEWLRDMSNCQEFVTKTLISQVAQSTLL